MVAPQVLLQVGMIDIYPPIDDADDDGVRCPHQPPGGEFPGGIGVQVGSFQPARLAGIDILPLLAEEGVVGLRAVIGNAVVVLGRQRTGVFA